MTMSGVPQLDKDSIAGLGAFVGCFFIARRPIRFWNDFGVTEILMLVFALSPLVTAELNEDPIVNGGAFLPGVGTYDGLSARWLNFYSRFRSFWAGGSSGTQTTPRIYREHPTGSRSH